MGESTTFFKDGMKRLRKNPLAMGSIIVTGSDSALIIYRTALCTIQLFEISLQWTASVTRPQRTMAPFEYSKLRAAVHG